MKLGVCTACIPEYEPLEALERLGELGYEGVAWRIAEDDGDRTDPTFWSGNRCTMTAEEIIERADELKGKSAATGVAMQCLATYCTPDDLAAVELHMRAAVAVGAGDVRLFSSSYRKDGKPYPEQLRELKAKWADVAALAEQHGVRALVETHRGHLTPSVHKAAAVMEGLDPKHVGIIWDPGSQVFEGREVYPMAIQSAGPYLAHVHARNSRWVRCGQKRGQVLWEIEYCGLKDGIVDCPELIDNLKKADYSGWIFFEDFSRQRPTDVKLRENIKWFRELIG